MKNNIEITNLTQVFVGSGDTLQNGTDFIICPTADGKESDIFIIDPNRVGEIIGFDEKIIQQWVASIEKKDTDSFFKLYLKGHKPAEYSIRRITNYAGNNPNMTLKTCIHDGMGRPYIPGSSIKGAIRTAIISYLAEKTPQEIKERLIDGMKNKNDSSVEKYFLGNTPNDSLMRFIRVGDAFYNEQSEIAITQISLNERERTQDLIYKSKSQAVEAISGDLSSHFALAIDKKKFDLVFSKHELPIYKKELSNMKSLPQDCSSIPALFQLINEHTKKLVDSDIAYWKDKTDSGFFGAEDYIENMEQILSDANACKTGECVMRIGQASGWRFMTGAWTEELNNFKSKVVNMSRPQNEKNYRGYDFPKTRRIDDESLIFGFVKLRDTTL